MAKLSTTEMIPINKRKVVTCVLLTIITGGIFGYYWNYLLMKNIRAISKSDKRCAGELLCLIFVPFYSIYWWYTRGKDARDQFAEHGYPMRGHEVAYLLLAIYGLGIVAMAIMQRDFNELSAREIRAV